MSLNNISPEYELGSAPRIADQKRRQKLYKFLVKSMKLVLSPKYTNHPEWWLEYDLTHHSGRINRYLTAKRFFDLLYVLLSLPLIIPLFLICAGLIKLESLAGPVLFIQRRTGKDGHRFSMYKFRTMALNAEELKQTYAHLNELEPPDFKITNDPRITRVGRFLRKTSLDELPQVINILRGEMSLVGPRPTSFPVETYKLWHTVRLEMTPGLTGLWQVIGRGSTEFDERVRLDYEYWKRRSLSFDLMIILHTFLAAFRGK